MGHMCMDQSRFGAATFCPTYITDLTPGAYIDCSFAARLREQSVSGLSQLTTFVGSLRAASVGGLTPIGLDGIYCGLRTRLDPAAFGKLGSVFDTDVPRNSRSKYEILNDASPLGL
ncbi:hypothetical protein EVAR_88628_1 [Eumeta japonica]|uniref:Uncharacterized protein n=1 Tax=Eumeta variegata TaxID=151549 RepID=A0A4C1X3Q0_EUMVA|nr:hypothetical protein EVAR_88628_1 [Eumeta japonica]